MITTSSFISHLKKASLLAAMRYSHPVLTLDLLSDKFDDGDYEHNVEVISEATGLTPADVLDATSRPLIGVRYFRDDNDVPAKAESLADHWMAVLSGAPLSQESFSDELDHKIRAVHFYGYKGGQARSTALAMVAKRLADAGQNVLIVDADIEAPSLHLLFNSAVPRLSGSLMGVCDEQIEIRPVAAYAGKDGGHVDLIGCRPSGKDYDLDFLAFALSTSLDPSVLRHGFSRLRKFVESNKAWDIALVDHRTGVAPSVIPTLSAWPGSTVMTLRPDILSTPATQIARTLFSAYPSYPGAFLNFSLDPEERKEQNSAKESKVKDVFLQILAEATEKAAETDESIDPQTLEANFINWYFDRALLDDLTPDFDRLSKDNQDSITDLIQVIGIGPSTIGELAKIDYLDYAPFSRAPRAPSGARDFGWFIETRDISTLMQASSAFAYIFGRKGTGKTRVYREMHSRGKGTPLFAASDYSDDYVRAQSVVANALLEKVDGNFEAFWWKLIDATLRVEGKDVERLLTDELDNGVSPSLLLRIYSAMNKISKPMTLLIDGVETAVSSRHTKHFVESLFRVLSTIQNNSSTNEKIQFKLFIRPDLTVGIQNVEQQIAGRKLELRWNEDSIFNYMLSEIERKNWFNSTFQKACDEIALRKEDVKESKVERDDYERILLSIFPIKLRRNNLLTMTFLRTYFSDSVSEASDRRSSFYPRVVGSFLDHVENLCVLEPDKALDADNRVSHSVILEAFAKATAEFINEIKQELYFALDMNKDVNENRVLVDDLINSLAGLQTPFLLDECVDKLQAKLATATGDRTLRDALRQMKDMGIFETHPVDPNKWRAGRLFKEALRMKYVR